MSLLHTFYTAFAQRDHAVMGACYHGEARFSDPVFPDLDAGEVRAMWRMLLSGDTDLCISFTVEHENEKGGRARWEAFYTFGRKKRKVHNIITSDFTFKEGLIHTQRDRFNFWRWSRQALGLSGLLLGWTPAVERKVQGMAASRLRQAMIATA
ncbi:MAG: nuclear transport factor 2 family protein [Flavobacteriales bacterium]|nr:nuclear transport factor 2 family protein [Flavobacteriales bacterium]